MRHKKYIYLILSAFFIVGCNGSDHKDLRKHIEQVRKRELGNNKKTTIKEIKLPTKTTYQASTLRPPFLEPGALPGPKAKTSNPLQMYPLTMLRFVGTLTKNSTIYAYIVVPDGMVYQIKAGDTIGDHNGKVMSVEPYQVNIREEESVQGKPPMQRIITLQLKEAH